MSEKIIKSEGFKGGDVFFVPSEFAAVFDNDLVPGCCILLLRDGNQIPLRGKANAVIETIQEATQ